MSSEDNESKAVQRELGLSQDRLDTVPDWVWEHDPQGRFTYCSAAAETATGYSPSELLGTSCFDYLVDEDAAACRELYARSVATGQFVGTIVARFRTKDGRERAFEIATRPYYDEQGGLQGFRGIARDVTERVEREKAAAEVSESFRLLVENSPTGIVVIQDAGIVYANARIASLMGYKLDEALGRNVWEFVHPDDRELVRDRFTRRLAGEDVPDHYEVRAFTKTGEVRHFEVRATRMTYDGRPAVLDNIVDITERKQAEEQLLRRTSELEAIMHAFPDLYFWLDADGSIQDYHVLDPSALHVSPEEFLGRRPVEVLPGEAGKLFQEAAARAGTSGAGEVLEYSIPFPEGLEFFEGRMVPLPGSGTLAIVRNMTERVRLERMATEASENYRRLVEDSPTGMFVLDGDLLVYANPKMMEIMGYTLEEKRGQDIWQFIHPEDLERIRKQYQRQLETGKFEPESFDVRVITKSGETRHLELRSTHITYGGKPAELDSVIDVTEHRKAENALRESEERYRGLVDTSPDAILVTVRGRHVFANEAAAALFGASSPRDLIGLAAIDVISPEYREIAAARMRLLMEGRTRAVPYLQERILRLDGSEVDVEIRASLVTYAGEPALLAVARDITERKRAEQAARDFERSVEAQKRQFYRDTILSVTGGKLDICEAAQVRSYIRNARIKLDINEPSQASQVRCGIERFCRDQGLEGERLECFMIGVGEALNNAIKHAERGRAYAGVRDGAVWVAVADKGKGIDSLILPQVTLLRGFSTQPSLGLGYSIMLEVADQLLLKTDRRGTVVVLVKHVVEPQTVEVPAAIPDTWGENSG